MLLKGADVDMEPALGPKDAGVQKTAWTSKVDEMEAKIVELEEKATASEARSANSLKQESADMAGKVQTWMDEVKKEMVETCEPSEQNWPHLREHP